MNLAYGYELDHGGAGDITLNDSTRLRSVFCLGSTGSGKSSLLETWLIQDIRDGVGFACFDVEDRLNPRVLRHLQDAGREPVVIDPTIGHLPLNVLAVKGVSAHTVIEQVLQAFKRAWFASWGERLEDLLRHSLMALQEAKLTLGELPHFLSNQAFRERVAEASQDARVRLYFLDHLRNVPAREWRVWVESTRNKVAALMDNPYLSPSLSCDDCLDFLDIMDQGLPLIINLPESSLGDSGRLYAMLLISKLYQAALQRPHGSRPFFVYADEFAQFATRTFIDLCTRSRKRGVGSIMAMQTVNQPPFDQNPEFLQTILSNVATTVIMQCGRADAEVFAKQLYPASGTTAKRRKKHWLWGDHGEPTFYSLQEERELQYQELEQQRQRECIIKLRDDDAHRIFICEAYKLPEPNSDDATSLAYDSIARLGVPLVDIQQVHEARLSRFKRSFPQRRS